MPFLPCLLHPGQLNGRVSFKIISESYYLTLVTISGVSDKFRISNMQLWKCRTQHTNSEEFNNSFCPEPPVQMCYEQLICASQTLFVDHFQQNPLGHFMFRFSGSTHETYSICGVEDEIDF